jgi:hypothetical protein
VFSIQKYQKISELELDTEEEEVMDWIDANQKIHKPFTQAYFGNTPPR